MQGWFNTPIKKHNLTRFITSIDRPHFYENNKTGLVFFYDFWWILQDLDFYKKNGKSKEKGKKKGLHELGLAQSEAGSTARIQPSFKKKHRESADRPEHFSISLLGVYTHRYRGIDKKGRSPCPPVRCFSSTREHPRRATSRLLPLPFLNFSHARAWLKARQNTRSVEVPRWQAGSIRVVTTAWASCRTTS
jgi:hypothetical protein